MFLLELTLLGSSRTTYQRYSTKAMALAAQAHYRSCGATALLLCSANVNHARAQSLIASC